MATGESNSRGPLRTMDGALSNGRAGRVSGKAGTAAGMPPGLELDSIPGSLFGGTDDHNPVHPVTWLERLPGS